MILIFPFFIYQLFVKFDLKSEHFYLFTSYKKGYMKLEIMSVSVISEDKDDFDWKESIFQMSVQKMFSLAWKQEKCQLEVILAGESHIAHAFHVREISIAFAPASSTLTLPACLPLAVPWICVLPVKTGGKEHCCSPNSLPRGKNSHNQPTPLHFQQPAAFLPADRDVNSAASLSVNMPLGPARHFVCRRLRDLDLTRKGFLQQRECLFLGFLPDSCELLSDPSVILRCAPGPLDLALPHCM